MKNRLLDYLPTATRKRGGSKLDFEALRDQAQSQFNKQMLHVQTSIQEYPLAAITAAVCVGVFLGWMVKRR